jgi:hypothetical protein
VSMTLDGRQLPDPGTYGVAQLHAQVRSLREDFAQHGWHVWLSDARRVWASNGRQKDVLGRWVSMGVTVDADTPRAMREILAARCLRGGRHA